jgi:hypothetical protein
MGKGRARAPVLSTNHCNRVIVLKPWAVAALAVLLAACSVQKRRYTGGLYVRWEHPSPGGKSHSSERKCTGPASGNAHAIKINTHPEACAVKPDTRHSIGSVHLNSVSRLAGFHKDIYPKRSRQGARHLSALNAPDSCDVLVFKSGDELRVKVIEITSDEIRYYPCDARSKVLYRILKTDVTTIYFSNGSMEIIGPPEARKPDPAEQRIRTHPGAVVTFVLGVLSLPLMLQIFYGLAFAIMAIIFARRVKRTIGRNPDKYKGWQLAQAGMILGIIAIVLLVAVGVLIALEMSSLFFI